MEIVDFEFKKERKLGEFIQDFINLLKMISGHLLKVMFKLLLIPISIIVLASYYISTQLGLNIDLGEGKDIDLLQNVLIGVFFLIIVGLIAFGLSIEYFLLLRDRRDLRYGSRDVWRNFVSNLGKYFKFLVVAIFVTVLIGIPVGIIAFVCLFIPLVGSFCVGILTTMVMVWYFSAFLLYREGYYGVTNAFSFAFTMVWDRIFAYGLATYVIHFIFQSLMTLMVIIPMVVVFIISYNNGNFNFTFFDTFYGRLLISVGTSLFSIITLIYYSLSVLSYGVVYETAKEMKFGENIFERISNIGKEKEDE